ncbi:hypothetical protein VB796_01700 [Arcicella sp. LKC2W]|uniref:hypothetical protein n=1 Tax=Arcicella sp. LKC2W TaxID=2984198 RepID=UPI002B20A2A7|nr:hypothetical protein [Arcicella sp. LKC2W]MEA5457732.1 hypothetical protein [Arcicella sp. LKC2W]
MTFYLPKRYLSVLFSLLFVLITNSSFGQGGTFAWFNGTSGNTWAATDVSKTYTISCGTGCSVNVTMTIIDPNNRNCDPDTYTTNPFDTGNGCLPYPNGANVEVDNVTGNGNILDPWDSDCNPFFTQTNGAYGVNYLTFAMNSFTHLEDVTIRFTFSKPVFLDNFTIGDIDGRTLQQDRTQTLTGSPQPLSQYESPGNSYQDEVTVTAIGMTGNVAVNYSALGSLTTQVGQTVRSVYNNNSVNLTPDDVKGTITVNTADAITQLDITYSNGPDDGAAEQANPSFYSWWANGGTYMLSDGRTITQPAKGATNGTSDNHAIRISGFNFTACPDFAFTRTNAIVCAGKTANIGITPANGTAPYSYTWTGPNGFTSTSQNPVIPAITASQAGVYSVTAVDANGCIGTSTASVMVNPLPTPTIMANATTCVGLNLILTSGGGGTYVWNGPNSFTSNVQNPTITNLSTNATGTYTVTITGANGCTASATTLITVNPNPVPTVNSPEICAGASTTLTVGNCSGTVTWDNGLSAGASVTVSPSATKIYTATCTVGSCTGTVASTVTVNPNPVPTVNSPEICVGASTTLTVSNCSGTVTWDNGLSAGASVTVSPSATKIYTATCTVGSCTGTVASTVTVNPNPVPTVNSPEICVGASTTLTVSNCSGTVTWDNGLSAGASVTVSPSATKIYTATCTVGSCTGTVASTVTVKLKPTLSISSVVCSADLTTYTITFSSDGIVSSSSGSVDNTAKTVSNIAVGTNVVLTATLNGCILDVPVTSPSCPCPNVPAPVSGGNKVVCSNTSIPPLTVTVGNNESANWYNSNGVLVASNTLSYTPTTAGIYTVESYNLTNNCKSSTSVNISLVISPAPTITPKVKQATCFINTANNDASISFTTSVGDKYGIVQGASYSGASYGTAAALVVNAGSLTGISNPSVATQYTIRVFNGSNTCFTDATVVLNTTICSIVCEPLKCLPLKIEIKK